MGSFAEQCTPSPPGSIVVYLSLHSEHGVGCCPTDCYLIYCCLSLWKQQTPVWCNTAVSWPYTPSFVHHFESKERRGFYVNIWLVSTICPHKHTDVVRSKNITMNLLVLCTGEGQWDNLQSLMAGDKGKTECATCCLRLQGETKALWKGW